MSVHLEQKRAAHVVPSYSLTGDLLSYMRCELQYRYYNGSALPPSRPVQLWYGEFIHGVLEAAYRYWRDANPKPTFPWPCTPRTWNEDPPDWMPNDIGAFGHRIETVLALQGKNSRSAAARDAAYRRANAAVNMLGPHLFPLITAAEEPVIGTRSIPQGPGDAPLRADRYELHGVIDVITRVTLSEVGPDNVLRAAISEACPNLPQQFEIILDYKGATRPTTASPYWNQGKWQVQTYGYLRRSQTQGHPVVAGVLLYIDELDPGQEGIQDLQAALRKDTTDVRPVDGSQDARILRMWRKGEATDTLSANFRLRRAIRVVPITPDSLTSATGEFDKVVRNIEERIAHEADKGTIASIWDATCDDDATCRACDFRHFCPSPAPRSGKPYVIESPAAP